MFSTQKKKRNYHDISMKKIDSYQRSVFLSSTCLLHHPTLNYKGSGAKTFLICLHTLLYHPELWLLQMINYYMFLDAQEIFTIASDYLTFTMTVSTFFTSATRMGWEINFMNQEGAYLSHFCPAIYYTTLGKSSQKIQRRTISSVVCR